MVRDRDFFFIIYKVYWLGIVIDYFWIMVLVFFYDVFKWGLVLCIVVDFLIKWCYYLNFIWISDEKDINVF